MKSTFIIILALSLAGFSANAQERYNQSGTPGAHEVIRYQLPGFSSGQDIHIERVDGLAIFEGDIMLYPVRLNAAGRPEVEYRWPNGWIPYVIQNGHPDRDNILEAIRQVNSKTVLSIFPRSNEENYVEFVSQAGCSSPVGRIGGKQTIRIGGCGRGSIMHEILHTAGLYHEQSRSDRDNYVRINFGNIEEGYQHNFNRVSNSINICSYDFGSIMHYPPYAFSRNGQPTIEAIVPIPPGVVMGQRADLSSCDIKGIRQLYPNVQKRPGIDLSVSGISNVARTRFTVEVKNTGLYTIKRSDIRIEAAVYGEKDIDIPSQSPGAVDVDRVYQYPALNWTGGDIAPGAKATMTCTYSQPSPLPMFEILVVKAVVAGDSVPGNNSRTYEF